jgi:hypothetical protein
MIVRILGEGQFDIADGRRDELNTLDSRLQAAVEACDAAAFAVALHDLLDTIRRLGTPLAADEPAPSDLVLPGEDTTLEQVRALLAEEGLIPGCGRTSTSARRNAETAATRPDRVEVLLMRQFDVQAR